MVNCGSKYWLKPRVFWRLDSGPKSTTLNVITYLCTFRRISAINVVLIPLHFVDPFFFKTCHGFPCVKRRTSAKSPAPSLKKTPPPPLQVDPFSKKSAVGGTMSPEIWKKKWKILPNCHIFLREFSSF